MGLPKRGGQILAQTELGRQLERSGAQYLGYEIIDGRRREYFHVKTTEQDARCSQIAICVLHDWAENLGVAFDPEFIKTLKK